MVLWLRARAILNASWELAALIKDLDISGKFDFIFNMARVALFIFG